MGEQTEGLQVPDITIPTEPFERIIKAQPDHPFSLMGQEILDQRGSFFADSVTFGISGLTLASGLLSLGLKTGLLRPETLVAIDKAFSPLQHASNMGASLGIMGVSVGVSEFLRGYLERANKENLARFMRVAIPVVGAVSAVAFQHIAETRQILPWDTPDKVDEICGIVAITPSFFAVRHYMKGLRLREKGAITFGKLKSKFTNPRNKIVPSDITVINTKIIK